ncbi:MAG: EMC3/TMCO1 family protein [Candidatus Aenigmatarchaeota archaeon]
MAVELSVLVVVTGALSLISTIIQKKMIDVDLVRTLKADMKKLQQEMKKHRQNPDKTMELSKKQLEISKQIMSQQMKPSMISSVPVLIAFVLFGKFFEGLTLALPFALPYVGAELGWLGIFILVMLTTSIIFRKALGMDLT